MSKKTLFDDWGRISYKEAWDKQSSIHNDIKEKKLDFQRNQIFREYAHHLIFCEHNPVYTLGKSGKMEHLLIDTNKPENNEFEFFKINRGGDITYHGPGQIVAYPIFDLDDMFTDVHKYVRFLEEAVIRTIAKYGLEGIRLPEHTGVWLKKEKAKPFRKICAIGVHLSRWVTMHGLAFNVNTDLAHFDHIIPCGIEDENKSVSSMAAELGSHIDIEEVKGILKDEFINLFELKIDN
jgi:lipoyl(octanoyl) transferase